MTILGRIGVGGGHSLLEIDRAVRNIQKRMVRIREENKKDVNGKDTGSDVTYEDLAKPPFGRFRWGVRSSGTYLPEFIADALEDLWEARVTAQRLGFPNLAIDVPGSIADDFARIVADLDEPFADVSMFPTFSVSELAREHVKVVLSGELPSVSNLAGSRLPGRMIS